MSYVPRLQSFYRENVVPVLMEKYKYSSIMEVPKLVKICVNQGIGAATQDKKLIDIAIGELSIITGQKPVATMSRNAISMKFKIATAATLN